MTRDDILAMPAGREMDVTVGYHVMDLHGPPWIYPKYSTDIAAAWEVLDTEAVREWMFEMEPVGNGMLRIIGKAESSYSGATIIADTAPLAICRAALLAVLG